MKAKRPSMLFLAVIILATISCYRPFGYRFYPHTPRFAPTNPPAVDLLRREPRRDHIRLGEVWIRPHYGMDRFFDFTHMGGEIRGRLLPPYFHCGRRGLGRVAF